MTDCVCGGKPKLLIYKTIRVVLCEKCKRFSTGGTPREAMNEWELMQYMERKDEQDK